MAAPKATKTARSKIELVTFAIFKVHGRGTANQRIELLYGAADSRFGQDGRVQLLANNVPYRKEIGEPQPGHGLLTLYGVNDQIEELQYWRAVARQEGAEFAYAKITVDVGYIEVGLTNREMLKEFGTVTPARPENSRFLNIRRMAAPLQKEMLAHFQSIAKRDQVPTAMESVVQMATRPAYWDHVFAMDPDMRDNLDVLVIPIADDEEEPHKVRYVAYLRPGANIVSISQGYELAEIMVPRWLTDPALAEQFRRELKR
jgi:hypothetical protein